MHDAALTLCVCVLRAGDLILFFRTADLKSYLAFNRGAPGYYLSPDSYDAIIGATSEAKKPDHILGLVVYIDHFEASLKRNPFRLALGTPYHEVTASNTGS